MSESNSTENIITPIRKDIAVLKACLENDVEVTDKVLSGVWRWFGDVEIAVPLPVMDIPAVERRALASIIVNEMDETFAILEERCEGKDEEFQSAQTKSREATIVNNLWKELAGCYAALINDEVPVLPSFIREALQDSMISDLVRRFDQDENEIRRRLKTDSALRMMLRMSGLNPDDIR